MSEQKTTFVTDSVHGSVPLSPCEKKLISTEVYNRLHNVLQNSAVYFTYPSNRTSRFIHSLGCLKITGELIRNGILNADEQVALNFFKAADLNLEKICSSRDFENDITSQHFKEISRSFLIKKTPKVLRCQLYTSAMLPRLPEENEYLFIVLYQAVRFAALLHDVGHPPFSHVTEYGITSTYDWIESNKDRILTLKSLSDHLGRFMNNGKAFHESLGLAIATFLLDQVIDSYKELYSFKSKLTDDAKKHLYDLTVIKHFTLSILKNTTPFLRSLHDLVDSDLDSDRLDYVIRDRAASGLSGVALNLDRLLQSYTLVSVNGQSKFAFVPSVRALSSIEDFYLNRFQLYKFVVYHHRVAKFDALLQNCVLTLARERLEKAVDKDDVDEKPSARAPLESGDEILLNSDISGLWQVLHPDVFKFEAQFVDYYIQWDDPWLLTILRKHHALLRKRRENDQKKSILEVQLEELLSNRKKYYSLYKRGECFLEVDKQFMLAFKKNFGWARLAAQQDGVAKKDVERLKKYINTVQQAVVDKKSGSAKITHAVEANGYSLSLIFRLLITLGYCTQNELPFAKDAARELTRGKNAVEDIIVIPKLIKPGVKKDFQLVDSDGKLVDLGKVSRIADELEREALLFPPFFVYLYCADTDKLSRSNIDKYRKQFAKELARHFDIWITKKLNL